MIKKNRFKLFFPVLLLILNFKQNLIAENLSDLIFLNNKDYVGKLLNGSNFIVKIDGKVKIENFEYDCLKVINKIDNHIQPESSDFYYDLTAIKYFNYENYLFLDFFLEGEYATESQVIISLKNKNIIMNRKFIYNPIKEILGFNYLLIFLCLERIEIFDLQEDRFRYQLFLKEQIKGIDKKKDGINIRYVNGKEEYLTYIDLSNLSNNVKYVSPKIDNLRLRELSSNETKIIRKLVKGEKLVLLEKGDEEIINEVKGHWIKVKTDKGEVGWCFDAYLKEVK